MELGERAVQVGEVVEHRGDAARPGPWVVAVDARSKRMIVGMNVRLIFDLVTWTFGSASFLVSASMTTHSMPMASAQSAIWPDVRSYDIAV